MMPGERFVETLIAYGVMLALVFYLRDTGVVIYFVLLVTVLLAAKTAPYRSDQYLNRLGAIVLGSAVAVPIAALAVGFTLFFSGLDILKKAAATLA